MHDPMQRSPSWARGSKKSAVAAGNSEDSAQLDIFAAIEDGKRRRDDGMRAVRHNTHTGWRLLVDRVISDLAAAGREFTAEDVRERSGHPLGSHDNALGAAMAAAARAGIIETVGYEQATRPEAHGRILRVWRGAS